MPSCCVKGCKSHSYTTKDFTYFVFPKNILCKNLWIQACNNNISSLKEARVCSKHFLPSCYTETYNIKKRLGYPLPHHGCLKSDAVPTEFLIKTEPQNVTILSSFEVASGDSVDKSMHEATTEIKGIKQVESFSLIEDEPQLQKEMDWKAEYLKKEIECKLLMKKVEKLELRNKNLLDILNKYFTPGQVKLLLQKSSKVHWTSEDISAALSLRSVSPKAYRYLKEVKHYPLPGLSTLKKWSQHIQR